MKVMLFGDSHLAALKRGMSQVNLPGGMDVQFWGTPGNRFRNISWAGNKIVPNDEKTADAFARFNAHGVRDLDPLLYDIVGFVGARIRPGAVIPDLLNHMANPKRHLTKDYMRLVLREHYLKHTTYQMAQAIAKLGKPRVLMNMIPFRTDGKERTSRAYKVARTATRDDIALLWQLTSEILAEDKITYVPQPVETVVNGYYTDAKYGLETDDSVHMNPDYGALMINQILEL